MVYILLNSILFAALIGSIFLFRIGMISTWNLLLVVVSDVILIVLNNARKSSNRLNAQLNIDNQPRDKVFTFANHKGGVGKTTIAAFVVKDLASRLAKTHNILVADASIGGDLTKLLLGPDRNHEKYEFLQEGNYTLERLVESFIAPKTWWSIVFGTPFSFFNHIIQIKAIPGGNKDLTSAPDNVYLISNEMYYLGDNYSRPVENVSDRDVNRFSVNFRAALAKDKKPWVVIVDTDGGDLHALTKLMLGFASSIIVPLSAGMNCHNDMDRLNFFFPFLTKLRGKNLSQASIDFAFFNNIESGRNEVWAELSSPFTPKDGVQMRIHEMKNRLTDPTGQWQSNYPEILKGLTRLPISNNFGLVRTGGVDFAKLSEDPWRATAGNADTDIALLTEKLWNLTTQNDSNCSSTAAAKLFT